MTDRRYIVSQQLVAANVENIAAMSWDGYQKKGRGAIVIEGEGVDDLEQVGPMVYLSSQDAQEARGGWPSEEVADMVEAYDPEHEVIVIVRWRGVSAYRFKMAVSPPVAYENLFKFESHND